MTIRNKGTSGGKGINSGGRIYRCWRTNEKGGLWSDHGSSHFAGEYPNTIQCAYIHLVSRKECDHAYPGQITQNMVCAGDEKHGKDSCQVRTPGPIGHTAKDIDGQEETDAHRARLGENQRQEKRERERERFNFIHRNRQGQAGSAETRMEMKRSRSRETQSGGRWCQKTVPPPTEPPPVLLGSSQAVQKGDPSQGAKGPRPLSQIPLTWVPATSSIGSLLPMLKLTPLHRRICRDQPRGRKRQS